MEQARIKYYTDLLHGMQQQGASRASAVRAVIDQIMDELEREAHASSVVELPRRIP